MPTDKDAYAKNFKDEDIVFEFPMLDTKLCNYDDMVKFISRSRLRKLKPLNRAAFYLYNSLGRISG